MVEDGGAPVAAQAAEVLLDAIKATIRRNPLLRHGTPLLGDRVHGGILGSFKFDPYGDMTPSPVTITRIEHGRGVQPTALVLVPSRLLH